MQSLDTNDDPRHAMAADLRGLVQALSDALDAYPGLSEITIPRSAAVTLIGVLNAHIASFNIT